MIYRLLQLKNALFPHIAKADLEWVKSILPNRGYDLFITQSAAEQRHALDVAHYLMKYSDELSLADFKTLIQASLLHDCGKKEVDLTLWHRVIIVLTNNLPTMLKYNLRKHSFFALPIHISERHPIWGRDLARKAGLSEEVCLMIERHHHAAPSNDLDRLLHWADNQN